MINTYGQLGASLEFTGSSLGKQNARAQTVMIAHRHQSLDTIRSFAKPALSLANDTSLTDHFTYYRWRVRGTETALGIRHDDDEALNTTQRDNLLDGALEYYRFLLNAHGDGPLGHQDARYYRVSLPTRETVLDFWAGVSEMSYKVACDALLGTQMFFRNHPARGGAVVAVISNPTISGIDPDTGLLRPIGYVIIRRNVAMGTVLI